MSGIHFFAFPNSSRNILLNISFFIHFHYTVQLFQLTLSDQSIKLQDKIARLYGIFSNKLSKSAVCRLFTKDLRWRAIWMKEMLGYQVDEVAAALGCHQER